MDKSLTTRMDNIVLFKTIIDKILKTYYSKSESKNEKKRRLCIIMLEEYIVHC